MTRRGKRAVVVLAEAEYDRLRRLEAATALEHGLTVVTRNVRHFEPTGAGVLDPAAEPASRLLAPDSQSVPSSR